MLTSIMAERKGSYTMDFESIDEVLDGGDSVEGTQWELLRPSYFVKAPTEFRTEWASMCHPDFTEYESYEQANQAEELLFGFVGFHDEPQEESYTLEQLIAEQTADQN